MIADAIELNRSSVSEPPSAEAVEEVIGFSKERRPICCLRRGHADAPLKVLILAGQHGDERPARRTVESLLAMPPSELARRLPYLQLAIVPEVNPDGCAVRSRFNAEGTDLNRDHQLLSSRETVAVHQLVRRWQPQVILDLHSYPSRRRHLLERNLVLNHDVFLDVPTHPVIQARPCGVVGTEVLQGLLRSLAARDIRADRYTIVEVSGRVRHSTPDVVDARNGLALRYGALTLLVENRQPRREESAEERLHLRTAQARALWSILEWFERSHDLFPPLFALKPPAPGVPVQVRFKYERCWQGLRLVCQDADQERPVSVIFSRYCASLLPRRTVLLPKYYAVPKELESLRAVLHRHGFISMTGRSSERCRAEMLRIKATNASTNRVRLTPHLARIDFNRYEVFPTRQNGGEALAVFLEPESQHGLHRFAAMQIPLVASTWYPVLRVFEGKLPSPEHSGVSVALEPTNGQLAKPSNERAIPL